MLTNILPTIFWKCYGILLKDWGHLFDNNYVEQISGINYDARCSSDISVCMFRLAEMINWYPWSSFWVILFSVYFQYFTFVWYVFEVWCHCPLYTCHTCIVHNFASMFMIDLRAVYHIFFSSDSLIVTSRQEVKDIQTGYNVAKEIIYFVSL